MLTAEPALAQVVASTPFVTLEAEAGTLGGGATLRVLPPGPLPTVSTPELEASGRKFVQLDATGESVTWTNTTGITINRMVIRASIPDAPGAPGSTFMLRKDAANTAAFYHLDLVDVESAPAPRTQPANTLSITSYGAGRRRHR